MAVEETTAPPRPGWGRRVWEFPITRILVFLLLLGAFATGLGLAAQKALPLLPFPPAQRADGEEILGAVGAVLTTLAAYAVMIRGADRRTLADAGLPVQGLVSETCIGLLIGGGLFSAAMGMLSLFRAYAISTVNAHFAPLVPLIGFLGVAFFEEVIFRGYVFGTLERRWGSGVALAGSGMFFGIAHLANPVPGASVWQHLAGPLYIIFEAGLPMAAAYLLTRRLWLPIGIHWGWNVFESSVYGVADSGTHADATHVLFAGRLSGPFLLTGGAFGPEAGIACLICGTYAGILLLRMAIRKGHWRGLPPAPHTFVTADTKGNTP